MQRCDVCKRKEATCSVLVGSYETWLMYTETDGTASRRLTESDGKMDGVNKR
jgi:hypothetical protein